MAYKAIVEARKAAEAGSEKVRESVKLAQKMKREEDEAKSRRSRTPMTDQNQAPHFLYWWKNMKSSVKPVGDDAVEYIRKDLHDAAIKQRDELYAEMQAWKLRCVKAEAERDQALAASAAREIAMRDRAAVIMASKYGKENISTIPLSPDGQQALNDVRADAWDEGYQAGLYADKIHRPNPHRKDA